MKLSRRGKRTKCAKRFKLKKNTKKQFRQYKRKNTHRKHSHKLRKNKRVMRGGEGEYDFILDADSSKPGKPVYNSSGLLTYRRDKAFTNKTKEFIMTLSYDDAATTTEKIRELSHKYASQYELFTKLSPTGGRDGVYNSQLETLNRINPLTSRDVERKICAVFKLEMTSTDEKTTKFLVYFKLYTAIAETINGKFLIAFVTYALDTNFRSPLPRPIIETNFMKIDDMSPSLTVVPLFNNAVPLVIPDGSSSTDNDKNCTFSFKDNSDFFSKLTYTMVKYAADIKYAEQQGRAEINEYEKM